MSRQARREDSTSSAGPTRRASSRQSSTKVNHDGFNYTKAWASNSKKVFRCSVYRGTGCKARLALRPAVNGYELVNTHTCVQPLAQAPGIVDCTTAMKHRVDSVSVLDLTKPVNEIWTAVSGEFYPADDVIRRGLSEEQVTRRVYRARQNHYGAYILGRIEVPPLSMIEGKNLSFFQFHMSRPRSDPTSKPDRIIGWAHPELCQLLMYNGVSLFFDGTFRCVPTAFSQCMIMMVHDQASDLFVPVYFVLCSSKAADTYFDILEMIHRDTSEKLKPSDILCDFELALIQAIEKQFPNAEVIGCLFHFKQAVRRRMKTCYHIPEDEICVAMEKGVLDVLTVIEPELVPLQGIRWVKRAIRTKCAAAGISYTRTKWKQFWGYFRATWLERYNIESWNVHGLQNSLAARTNNPLERFHRELNRSFPTPHPSITTFVSVIRAISQSYVEKLGNVAQGRRKRGNRRRTNTRKGRSRNAGSNSSDHVEETIELPTVVEFTEEDAASDSESETEWNSTGESSGSEEGDDNESSAEMDSDFSFESGEYCDGADDGDTTSDARDEAVV